MAKTSLSITFLYPSRRVGGAQLLFIRLAKELSKNEDISVNVVDYVGGYLEGQLSSHPNIKVLPYRNSSVDIENGTVVVTPLSNFADLQFLLKGDLSQIKVLFWSIHPTNLNYVLNANGRKWFGGKAEVKNFLHTLSDQGNIIYMDEANFLAVKEEIQLPIKPTYLQIPLEIKEYKKKERAKSDKLNIGWLGRISYDKINSLIKIIDEISALPEKNDIVFHVIGNGERINELEEYLKKSNINYVLVGVLIDEDLSLYMNEFIHLGVAMGTSCMEFAARKIPVFLVDFGYKRFPEKIKYNWLFETNFYSLGSEINPLNHRNHSFRDLVKQCQDNPDIGQKCYNYVVHNHNIKDISLKLIDYCQMLKEFDMVTFNRIQRKLNPPIYSKIYSLYRRIRNF